ncbi:F-box/kelch-repeat protein At3g23880-like [Papaver somniferum]|uniref:F-box/kelch-repeat protein At3g23880-like n=1 Tax=Papaver somniferum TaxID=3469 RepID=UPI000E6F53AA|nr:F-box/kelch-repeat protein At3g23880-like [Papaver somniferum]
MDCSSRLPPEITLEILSRVPSETILDCKAVCRIWRNLLRPVSFSKIHFHHHHNHDDDSGKLSFLASTSKKNTDSDNLEFKYFEYNKNHDSETSIERIKRVNFKPPFSDAKIVASSNGLLCLTGTPSVCICNPITREHIMLPEIKTQYCDSHQNCMWTNGFGYLSSTNEYKVVAIHASSQPVFVEVQIYTLGSRNGWRNLGRFNMDLCQLINAFLPQGIFANGALYWIAGDLDMIVTFDLAEEKFCENLSPPPSPPNGTWIWNGIRVLDGCLYIAVWKIVEEDGGDEGEWFDIWLLKKKNNNDGLKEREGYQSLGWTKEFRLVEDRLVAVTKSGGVITHVTYRVNCFNIYDLKSSTPKRFGDLKECFVHEIFPHKNTLVSLKELGEEDTKIMEPIEIEKTGRRDLPLEQPKEVEALDALLSLKEIRVKDKEIMESIQIEETESHGSPSEKPEEDEARDT